MALGRSPLFSAIAAFAARAGRPSLYGLSFTSAAYVLYDLARLLQGLPRGNLSGLFPSPLPIQPAHRLPTSREWLGR